MFINIIFLLRMTFWVVGTEKVNIMTCWVVGTEVLIYGGQLGIYFGFKLKLRFKNIKFID